MKTPAGKDCPEYYADFHRGRHHQECRLAIRSNTRAPWHPGDCARCTVPDILRANSDVALRLKLVIKPGILGIGRAISVEAHCDKHQIRIADPYVGCPQCNAEKPGADLFLDALKDSDPE